MEIIKYFFSKHIEKCRNKLNEINTDAEELKNYADKANKFLNTIDTENYINFHEFNKYIENLNSSFTSDIHINKLETFSYDENFINDIYKHSAKYLKSLDKLISLSKEDFEDYKIELYKHRGDVKTDLNMYDDAIEDYKKALKLNPNYIEAKKALEEADRKLKEYNLNKSFDNYYIEGVNYYNKKQFEDALKTLNKAIELDPNKAKAYLYRGVSQLVMGRNEEAIKDFDKAIELDPNYPKFYLYRGHSKNLLKKYEEAVKDFDKAIELDSNYAKAYMYRGVSKLGLNKYEEAIKDFDKTIELNPNYIDAYYHRGLSKLGLNQNDEGIEDFDKIAELNPDNSFVYFVRGNIKKSLNKDEEALKDFQKYEELEKQNSQI
ncbi:tetratricopeptide repeat protein [Brachyspira murdochii]|uniref:TPR repeat-containing protein n=1 Tax=Brachyspira murdochii TaxID=84378 RepID=A0ABX5B937_9SPIR|nr:tetratricopeptide repeat protein [Brachyspira murdochii]PPS23142.1 hypothetical protein DJ52_00735 [Brachyspira murdochii]